MSMFLSVSSTSILLAATTANNTGRAYRFAQGDYYLSKGEFLNAQRQMKHTIEEWSKKIDRENAQTPGTWDKETAMQYWYDIQNGMNVLTQNFSVIDANKDGVIRFKKPQETADQELEKWLNNR